jgi:hypothetical protein
MWQMLFAIISWLAWLKRRLRPLPHPYKDIADLSLADFQRCPIWEYALDAEGDPRLDECTVRPRPDVSVCEPGTVDAGNTFALTKFVAANGAVFFGSVMLSDEASISALQPTILIGKRRVCFAIPPCEYDPTAEIARCYRRLRMAPGQLFPISVTPMVQVEGLIASQTIEGFTHLVQDENTKQYVEKLLT